MITELERQARMSCIGSSDAAAVLGLSPYQNQYSVWAEKRGMTEPFRGNEATDLGEQLEDSLVQWSLTQAAIAGVEHDVRLLHPEYPFLAANLDARGQLPEGRFCSIEAKTAGLTGPLSDEWGEEWTDQIPMHYSVQCHFQMMCGGPDYPFALVPALLGGRGRCIFKVERNEETIRLMLPKLLEFYQKNVVGGVAPVNVPCPPEIAKRMRRQPNKIVTVSDGLLEAWEHAKLEAKIATDAADEAKGLVLAALGDAECGETADGRKVTYYETSRKSYVVAECSYRTLRLAGTGTSKRKAK